MQRKRLFLPVILLPLLAACFNEVKAPSPEGYFKPTATVQDIMLSMVDPAADALWNSVSSTVTQAGSEDKQPHTEQQWQAVRGNAITLIEAANLLLIKGRQVAHDGAKSENPGIEESPQAVQRLLDADWASYVKFAYELHDAGVQALAAIDAKKPADLIVVGGHIDDACEQCHQHFWYPNQNKPK